MKINCEFLTAATVALASMPAANPITNVDIPPVAIATADSVTTATVVIVPAAMSYADINVDPSAVNEANTIVSPAHSTSADFNPR